MRLIHNPVRVTTQCPASYRTDKCLKYKKNTASLRYWWKQLPCHIVSFVINTILYISQQDVPFSPKDN